MPGDIAENCAFLSTRVDEAGLLFFETTSSLAYTRTDLPASLAGLGLFFHAHLPADLPWGHPAEAAEICRLLLDKAAFLGVKRGVLHPPAGLPEARRKSGTAAGPENRAGPHAATGAESGLAPGQVACSGTRFPVGSAPLAGAESAARRLAAFARAWRKLGRDPADILLENTKENSLHGLAGTILERGFSVCLDLGHVLAYGQPPLPLELLRRVRMLHLSAPGKGEERGRHLPLTRLDRQGRQTALGMCRAAPRDAVVMLELFDWRHIEESLPLAREWCS